MLSLHMGWGVRDGLRGGVMTDMETKEIPVPEEARVNLCGFLRAEFDASPGAST